MMEAKVKLFFRIAVSLRVMVALLKFCSKLN